VTDGKAEEVSVDLKKSLWLEISKNKVIVLKIELANIKKIAKVEKAATTIQETEINVLEPIYQFKIIWACDSDLKSEVVVLQQSANTRKANRDAEDWMTALEFMTTRHTLERFAI
jgi:hypothetical protein